MSRSEQLALLFRGNIQKVLLDFVQGSTQSLPDEIVGLELRPLTVGLLLNLDSWLNQVSRQDLEPCTPVQALCKVVGELDGPLGATGRCSITRRIKSYRKKSKALNVRNRESFYQKYVTISHQHQGLARKSWEVNLRRQKESKSLDVSNAVVDSAETLERSSDGGVSDHTNEAAETVLLDQVAASPQIAARLDQSPVEPPPSVSAGPAPSAATEKPEEAPFGSGAELPHPKQALRTSPALSSAGLPQDENPAVKLQEACLRLRDCLPHDRLADLELVCESLSDVQDKLASWSKDTAASDCCNVLESLLAEEKATLQELGSAYEREAEKARQLEMRNLQLQAECGRVRDDRHKSFEQLQAVRQQLDAKVKESRKALKRVEKQTARVDELEKSLKEAEENLEEASEERRELERLVDTVKEEKERFREERERLRKERNYLKNTRGIESRVLVVQNRETGPENRMMISPSFRQVVQQMGAIGIPSRQIVPCLQLGFDYLASELDAKEIKFAHVPHQSTVDQILLEMGALTHFCAAHAYQGGKGKYLHLESDGTTLGGTDYMAQAISMLTADGETQRWVLGWDAMPNHTVDEQLKVHAMVLDAIRRAGEWGLEKEVEELEKEEGALREKYAELEQRRAKIALMSLDADAIRSTMGDHAKDVKAKIRKLQERKRAYFDRVGGEQWLSMSEAEKDAAAAIADFGCCNHKMDNTIQKTALGFKDVYRRNPHLRKLVSIPNRKQALQNEVQEVEAQRRALEREAQQTNGQRGGGEAEPGDDAEGIVEDLLRANETGDSGGLVCAVICSVVFGATDSERPGAHCAPIRNWIAFKILEAKNRRADEEEVARLDLIQKAISSLHMVGKARFFEKARICGPALVAKDFLIEYLEAVVAPSKPLNHLEKRLLKALKDPPTRLEMFVLATVEFELGFPCIVAKGQRDLDNAWDWGPVWDGVEAALQGWRTDPTRLLDGRMPCVFGENVERGSGKMVEVIRGMYPEGCADWDTLKLLAGGACEQLLVCLQRFATDQLASKGGKNRRDVVGNETVKELPKVAPSNDVMEGVNGMGKQFLRRRPYARAVLASSWVAYKASGMVKRVADLPEEVRKRGAHWAMVEARKLRKSGTKQLQREGHGAVQTIRAQEEAARVHAREVRATEQKEGLEGLRKCQTVADVQKLWKGPPSSALFSASPMFRRQRLIDQLKRLRVVDGVKVPAYSSKKIQELFKMLCDLLGLGAAVPVADDMDIDEPAEDLPQGGNAGFAAGVEMGGGAGFEEWDEIRGGAETALQEPATEFEADEGFVTGSGLGIGEGGFDLWQDPLSASAFSDQQGNSWASPGLIEQAIDGDEDAFVKAVYMDGWEEYTFAIHDPDRPLPSPNDDLGREFERRLSMDEFLL